METYKKITDENKNNFLEVETPQEPKVERFQLEQIERKIEKCKNDLVRMDNDKIVKQEELALWEKRKVEAEKLNIGDSEEVIKEEI